MQDEHRLAQLLSPDLDVRWQLHAIQRLTTVALDYPEPQEWLDNWLAEAAESDEDHVRWVLDVSKDIFDLTSTSLERLHLLASRALLRTL